MTMNNEGQKFKLRTIGKLKELIEKIEKNKVTVIAYSDVNDMSINDWEKRKIGIDLIVKDDGIDYQGGNRG